MALFAEGLDTALYRLDPVGPSFRRVTGWDGRAAAFSASDGATAIAVLASTAYAPRDVSAGPPDGLIRISEPARNCVASPGVSRSGCPGGHATGWSWTAC